MFNKAKNWQPGQSFDVTLPDGSDWTSRADSGKIPTEILIQTKEKREREPYPIVDRDSYLAATYAHVLGLPDEFVFLAWGELIVSGLPGMSKPRVVEAVITEEMICIWWKLSNFKLIEVFMGAFEDLQGAEPKNSLQVDMQFTQGIYMGQQGKQILQWPIIDIGANITNDTHANRRTLECYYTLGELVKKHFA